MGLMQDFDDRLKEAMRAKDERALQVIRMVRTRLKNHIRENKVEGELPDAQVQEIIAGYVKQLKKSLPEFEKGGEAAKASIDYHHRFARINPEAFWFGPTFFDGSSVILRDRAGGRIELSQRLPSRDDVSVSGTHIRNNLGSDELTTTTLSFVKLKWASLFRIPRSPIGLSLYRFWVNDEAPLTSYTVEFDTDLIPKWTVRSEYSFGDDIYRSQSEEFLTTLRRGYFGGIPILRSRLHISRRLSHTWNLGLSHNRSGGFDLSTIDLSRRGVGKRPWQGYISGVYDWQQERSSLVSRLDYSLDRGQRNRIVLESRYSRSEWRVNLWLQLNGLFGFVDHRPFLIRDSHLNPASGGVKGRVFVDANANGLLDAGEPGLEEIEVVSDARRHTSTGADGRYVIPNPRQARRLRVSLKPETIPAIYTPTQATQEAMIVPGMFTIVNLGVAAFGTISGTLEAHDVKGERSGVGGVRILLIDEQGITVGDSITGRSGYYYLGEVRPGKYAITIDEQTLPDGLEVESSSHEVEVVSGMEPVELEDIGFLGEYTAPQEEEFQETDDDGVEYRVFD